MAAGAAAAGAGGSAGGAGSFMTMGKAQGGGAVIGAIVKGLAKKGEIDASLSDLNYSVKRLRSNARNARMSSYGQGNRFRMMSDFEQTRLSWQHARNIGQIKGAVGGSGAVADSGTTWDVIASQDASNQAEMNAFKTQADFKVQDFIDQGDAQYRNYMGQADQVENKYNFLKSQASAQIMYSMLGGGAQGASAGSSIYNATTG